MNAARAHRVVVVGAGITGLTTAHTILRGADAPVQVTVLESAPVVGGLIRTTPFGGLDAVDEGADAFLRRIPWATGLADELGLSDALTSPSGAPALVWHRRLHPIPGELLLGVPASVGSFARASLISPRGKLRAAIEPLLPRTTDTDSLGHYVRRRFGREILELLVDPLIGSIYAADTDRFSMAAVPQVADLTTGRSMLVAAARARRRASGAPSGPVFSAPIRGMGEMIRVLSEKVAAAGGSIVTSAAVSSIERGTDGYVVSSAAGDHGADSIVLASPARHTAPLLRSLETNASEMLSRWTHASVVLITMSIPAHEWPASLTGSGYLVPKPDQRWVTAASFGSNKWAHWRPSDGSMILRVSLGRDGLDVMDHDDDALVNLALADLKRHLGVDFSPTGVRVSRWPESFPQYRPHHHRMLDEIERSLAVSAPGVLLAGASYRGIGIPTCVQQARAAAGKVLGRATPLPQ